jgi:hypothetical protein
MSRFLCSVMVAVAVTSLIAAPAGAAPDEDFVVGEGGYAIPVTPSPIFPGNFLFFGVSIDAHSDPSGANPTGGVSFVSLDFGLLLASGPVTCLEVTGNSAIVGFDDNQGGGAHYVVQVVDNSAAGTSDLIAGPAPSVAGCAFGSGVPVYAAFGDYVVHDALPLTSKVQCKDGGWRDFTDDEGHPFENQGECVAFVEHAA